MSPAATPDAPTAIAPAGHRRRAREVAQQSRDLLRSPATRLFGFELESGRLRPGGLSAPARWLTLLGLATLGFLCLAVLVPGVAIVGPASLVRAIGLELVVRTGTVGATILVLGIGWELLVYGASRAAPSIRVAVGVLFLFSNGLLVANLAVTPSVGWAVILLSDVAKTCLVVVAVVLILGAFVREGPTGRRLNAASLLRPAPCVLTAVMSGSLLVLDCTGRGAAGVRGDLAAGAVQSFATIILLFAPLLYLSGMAVLSLSYTIGTATTETFGHVRRGLFGAVLAALFLAEAWFYGWRDRRDLWPAPRGWVILLHVVPVAAGFAALAFIGRRILAKRSEPVHGTASMAVALLVAVPSIVGGLYFALYSISTLGFFHVPTAVRNGLAGSQAAVVSVFVSTGPRCVLFAVTTTVALVVARDGSISIRHRESALCLAFMSFWVFWTLFVDWLPGTDTADTSLLSLTVVGTAAAWVAVKWRELTERDLARTVGLLVVVWLLDADAGLLRSLAHLATTESRFVLVGGVLLVLAGKSQFTANTSRRLPRDSRATMWIGYLVLSLSVAWWDRNVGGFAQLTAHNAELSVFGFIALPYAAWLVISERFETPLFARSGAIGVPGTGSPETAGEPSPAEAGSHRAPALEPGGTRPIRKTVSVAVAVALVLLGTAWGAYAIDTAAMRDSVPLSRGVAVEVAPHWKVAIRSSTLFEATRTAPAATFSVLLEFTTATRPSSPLATYLREQTFLADVRRGAVTTFQLPVNGNFSEVSLGHFSALYSGNPVFGEIFSLLNPATGSLAIGVAFADSHADYHEVGSQIASMEESLDTPRPRPLW
jgi:hypothetical protein